MRKQDQLNALINKLSKQEKRYFKLLASLQTGDKKFIQLFDELQKSETYEPEKLVKKLQLSKPMLGHVKNYLQQELLRSLRLYAEDTNLTMSLYNRWQEARLLHFHNQHEMAFSICEKALEKALAYENFSVAHNLLALKFNLLQFMERIKEAKIVAQQTNLAIEQLAEIQQLMNLILRFSDRASGINETAAYKEVSSAPVFRITPAKLKSNSARILWHEMQQNYTYYAKGNLKKAISHNLSKLAIFEKNPSLIYTWPNSYLISMGYLGSHYGELHDQEKSLQFAEQLERETDGRRKDLPLSLCHNLNLVAVVSQLQPLFFMERFKDTIVKCEYLYGHKRKLSVNYLILTLHVYSLALFYTGRYDEARKMCEEVSQLDPEVMQDLHIYNKIVLVMLHYNLKNYSLLPYLINSAAAWAKRHKLEFAGTTEIISWLRKLERETSSGGQKLFFKEFKAAVEKGVFKKYSNELMLSRWIGLQPS